MNEDTEELENNLRRWRPREAGDNLARRVALDLECPPAPRRTWWRTLGFDHPLAACGWGLAAPALVILSTVLVVSSAQMPIPAPSVVRRNPEVGIGWQPAGSTNQRLETNDEGVVLDESQRPVRRTRYRSVDTIAWRNPQTGAELEVSYPREDVVMIPVTTR